MNNIKIDHQKSMEVGTTAKPRALSAVGRRKVDQLLGDFPASNTGVKSFSSTPSADVLPVFHAGVDWLTLSATTAAGAAELELLFCEMVPFLREEGELPKESKWLQYRGTAVGSHFFYGDSKDGRVVRASAHVADDVMWRLRRMESIRFKATRVDTQLTVLYPDQPGREFFRNLADGSFSAAQSVNRRGRPWHVALRDEYGRGDTVYLGDRSSELFQRVYDKHFETRNKGADGKYPPGAVRFEVEQKGSQAVRQLGELRQVEMVAPYVAGYVRGAFEVRGVPVPIGSPSETLIRSAPRVSDAQRMLKWFRETVAPAYQSMVAAGYGDEVLKALGVIP